MRGTRILSGRWAMWVLFILGWVTLSLLFAPEVYLYFLLGGTPISLRETFELTVVNAAVALLFLPLIVRLTRRYPFERKTWGRAMLVHFPACLVFSVCHSWLYWMACYASHELGDTLFFRFQPNLLTYWAIVGFTQAVTYFRRFTERERQLAQAELLLLKSQLHPHFLFNTLHTISAMMHEDVDAADRMISRISELLRMMVDTIGVHEVPLRRELDFLKKYVEIEQTRFSNTFQFRLEVDPATLDALVPSMILQPFVENSVRHGLILKDGHGLIIMSARRTGSDLLLRISDNGRGILEGRNIAEGLGIGNTRQRLRQLFGDNQEFRCGPGRSGPGFTVSIRIPFRTAADSSFMILQESYEANPSLGRG